MRESPPLPSSGFSAHPAAVALLRDDYRVVLMHIIIMIVSPLPSLPCAVPR